MLRTSWLSRVGVASSLVVIGLPTSSEACWLLRCCKPSQPRVVYVVPEEPAKAYAPRVLKRQVCRDPYVAAKCNKMNQWEQTNEREKEACVRSDLLGWECGAADDPYPVNDEPHHLYPAKRNLATHQWERAKADGLVDGFVPKHRLPKSQF